MSVQVQRRIEVKAAKPTVLNDWTERGTVLLYLLTDVACILLSFYLSYIVRFDSERLWTDPFSLLQLSRWTDNEHFQSHFLVALAMGVFLIVLLYHNKLYATERGVRYSHEFAGTLNSILWTLAFGVVISFLFQRFVISRFVLLSYGLLLFPALFTWRLLKRKFVEHRFAMGYGRQNSLIIGAGYVGWQLKAWLDERRWLGLHVVGFLDDCADTGQSSKGEAVLGSLQEFEKVVTAMRVREVFITISSEREKALDIVTKAQKMGLTVKAIPELFNLLTRQMEFEVFGPFTVANLFRPTLTPGQRLLKRFEDLMLASLLGLVFAPLVVMIAWFIGLDSRGPIIFRQTRLGEGGRPFTLYKFRSMYVDADESVHREFVRNLIRNNHALTPSEDSSVHKLTDDPRVTRVGRLIRKFNLDELPQLWNVLKGDLSLIGPRPPLPYEYDQYEEFYKKRLLIKPGITGLWQVSGKYRLDFEQMVMLDIRYINEWSLWLDLRILLETIPQVVRGTGV